MTEKESELLLEAAWEMVSPRARMRMSRRCDLVEESERRVTSWTEDYGWAIKDPEWCEAIMLARLGANQ